MIKICVILVKIHPFLAGITKEASNYITRETRDAKHGY